MSFELRLKSQAELSNVRVSHTERTYNGKRYKYTYVYMDADAVCFK